MQAEQRIVQQQAEAQRQAALRADKSVSLHKLEQAHR